MDYGVAVRRVVGVVALLYAVLVVAMGIGQLLTGPTVLAYAAVVVLVPIAVIGALTAWRVAAITLPTS